MEKSFSDKLIDLLKTASRFVDDEGELVKAAVIDRAWKIDRDLVKLLIGKVEIKEKFFEEIEGHWIFNINNFIEYVSDKHFLANSYTRFRNRIGLNIDGKFLRERGEVSLVWPYKDCVLEGGQTKEEEKRKEIFFNEILAQDEIDRLFDPKVLTNWKRYTVDGDRKVAEIKRDKNGTIRENLIIKGNNLLALHSLKKQFRSKVKLIYIDPPYNTGNDEFGYNDNFNHSTWLTFMKNRLGMAWELLCSEGSIWINIDDGELHYCKVLIDEIFGRKNFLCNFIWQKSYGGGSKAKWFVGLHEHILCYAKDIQKLPELWLPPDPEAIKKYYKYEDENVATRGPYRLQPLATTSMDERPNLRYPIKLPDGEEIWPDKQWQWSKERVEMALTNNELVISTPESGKKVVSYKQYLKDKSGKVRGRKPTSIITGHYTQHGTYESTALFGLDNKFPFPKPEGLLHYIIECSTSPGDLVLDFVAGSATTSAVAHKMNRQWITIEQMDYVDNISIERLRKVVGIKTKKDGKMFEEMEWDQGGISKFVNWQGGGDFIYCELMKYNEAFMDSIQVAKTSEELFELWIDITEKSFLNWYVNPEMPEEAVNDFIEIGKSENGLEKQKKLLAELVNKNQLYVNLSEIDDGDFNVSEEDKELNQSFYGENA